MIVQLNTAVKFAYLDVDGVVLDAELLTVEVRAQDSSLAAATATATPSVLVPDLYYSPEVTLLGVGQFFVQWEYAGAPIYTQEIFCSTPSSGDFLVGSEFNLENPQAAGSTWYVRVLSQSDTELVALTVAPYDAGKGAYALDDQIIDNAGVYYAIWYEDVGAGPVAESIEPLTGYVPANTSLCNFVLVDNSVSPGVPLADTRIVCVSGGSSVATLRSDAEGLARGYLPPGEYTASLLKTGTVFSVNNIAFTVLPDIANTLNFLVQGLSPTESSPAAAPSVATLYARLFHQDGRPMARVPIQVELLASTFQSGIAVLGQPIVYYTDSNGYVEFDIIEGARISVNLPWQGRRNVITAPSGVDAETPTDLLSLISQSGDDQFDLMSTDLTTAIRRDL